LIARPELIRAAVEEILRFESSNQLGNRVDHGARHARWLALPVGTFITIGIGAANRDPDEFAGS
jgi:cytochrome P450